MMDIAGYTTLFFLPLMLRFLCCVPKALPYLSLCLFISFHSPELSQVKRRAVYGVVIASYNAPYLPYTLHSYTLRCSFQWLWHFFQSGVWHIQDHDTPLRRTFTAFCIYVSCSGSASCPMLHMLRKIQAHFVCTTCLYPQLPQLILFVLWQPWGCISWHSRPETVRPLPTHVHHPTQISTS